MPIVDYAWTPDGVVAFKARGRGLWIEGGWDLPEPGDVDDRQHLERRAQQEMGSHGHLRRRQGHHRRRRHRREHHPHGPERQRQQRGRARPEVPQARARPHRRLRPPAVGAHHPLGRRRRGPGAPSSAPTVWCSAARWWATPCSTTITTRRGPRHGRLHRPRRRGQEAGGQQGREPTTRRPTARRSRRDQTFLEPHQRRAQEPEGQDPLPRRLHQGTEVYVPEWAELAKTLTPSLQPRSVISKDELSRPRSGPGRDLPSSSNLGGRRESDRGVQEGRQGQPGGDQTHRHAAATPVAGRREASPPRPAGDGRRRPGPRGRDARGAEGRPPPSSSFKP